MSDAELVAFLQWALPKMGRRWIGYRKVRRQVRRRLARRMHELDVNSVADYQRLLESSPEEWAHLDTLTNITISRFYRDRAVYDFLLAEVLPALTERARAAGRQSIRVWSAGCANGEEPYTLAMMWRLTPTLVGSHLSIQILGTDIRSVVLQRAASARYAMSAMKDLPAAWRVEAFQQEGDELRLRQRFRGDVEFAQHDIRSGPPDGPFDLVLCRYLSFTYFDDAGQRETVRTLAQAMRPHGALVIGSKEDLPPNEPGFRDWSPKLRVFQRGTANDSMQ